MQEVIAERSTWLEHNMSVGPIPQPHTFHHHVVEDLGVVLQQHAVLRFWFQHHDLQDKRLPFLLGVQAAHRTDLLGCDRFGHEQTHFKCVHWRAVGDEPTFAFGYMNANKTVATPWKCKDQSAQLASKNGGAAVHGRSRMCLGRATYVAAAF